MKTAMTLFAALVALSAITARADDFESIRSSASRIDSQGKDLLGHLRDNYRPTLYYEHLLSDAESIVDSGGRLHELAHRGVSLSRLQRYVNRLNTRLHQLEKSLDSVDQDVRYGRGQFHGDTRYARHQLRAIGREVNRMADSLHSLQRQSRVGYAQVGRFQVDFNSVRRAHDSQSRNQAQTRQRHLQQPRSGRHNNNSRSRSHGEGNSRGRGVSVDLHQGRPQVHVGGSRLSFQFSR